MLLSGCGPAARDFPRDRRANILSQDAGGARRSSLGRASGRALSGWHRTACPCRIVSSSSGSRGGIVSLMMVTGFQSTNVWKSSLGCAWSCRAPCWMSRHSRTDVSARGRGRQRVSVLLSNRGSRRDRRAWPLRGGRCTAASLVMASLAESGAGQAEPHCVLGNGWPRRARESELCWPLFGRLSVR
jgi:hypothetical protein